MAQVPRLRGCPSGWRGRRAFRPEPAVASGSGVSLCLSCYSRSEGLTSSFPAGGPSQATANSAAATTIPATISNVALVTELSSIVSVIPGCRRSGFMPRLTSRRYRSLLCQGRGSAGPEG